MLKLQNNSKRKTQLSQYDLQYQQSPIEGACTLLAIQTISKSNIKFILTILLSIPTLGLPFLLMYWWPFLQRYFLYVYDNLNEATHFYIQNNDNQINIVLKQKASFFNGANEKQYIYFINRYLKYIIDDQKVKVLKYKQIRQNQIIQNKTLGWNNQQAHKLQQSFGAGAMLIQQPTALSILIKQIFKPLYIYLFFTLIIQIKIKYYYYCALIVISTVIGLILTIRQVLRVNQQIRQMSFYQIQLNVLRNGIITSISSLKIVPGDIVFFNNNVKLPFQGVIIQGQMLMNQCVLTGQSVPIIKRADQKQRLSSKQELQKKCNVFQGTTIVQVNLKKKLAFWDKYRQQYGIPVRVTQTNFTTLKGQLIRKILFPEQTQNIFQRQSYKFLYFLFFMTVFSYGILIIRLRKFISTETLINRGLDLLAISIPPTIVISMTIGIVFTIRKLKNKDIYTISPNQIIQGGILDTMCFDKTGTLTHDSMDFKYFIPSQNGNFKQKLIIQNYQKGQISYSLKMAMNNMSCNHTVVTLLATNQIIGDPMQIKLLQFTKSQLVFQTQNSNILFTFINQQTKGQVLHRFQFESELQRMSVITQIGSELFIFTKGSPQALFNILRHSEIPHDYQHKLKQYASSGFRILATGFKKIQKNQKQQERALLQTDLIFTGFQIFENGLKPQTKNAINDLRRVQVNTIMITGDNAITASNIGYQSGILDYDTKTLIINYKNSTFEQQQFNYILEGLNKPDFKRNIFKRKSIGISEQDKFNNHAAYINQLLDKITNNNYNLCMTGSAFNQIYSNQIQNKQKIIPPLLSDLLRFTHVYSRTKPYDKAQIVRMHQRTSHIVGMCGDGANDCAALNRANLGLSLSDTQASIAAAFTAKKRHIGSMVQLIKQSRAGLATNYSLFNIIASYSFIQYMASFIDQYYFSYPGDNTFVYWDFCLNAIFVFIIGDIDTADVLSKKRPSANLFSLSNILSLLVFNILQLSVQVLAILAAAGPYSDKINYYGQGGSEVNYKKYVDGGANEYIYVSVQNNITFLISNILYITGILVFNKTKPWKKEFYTNKLFTILIAIFLTYNILMMLVPGTRFPPFQIIYLLNFDYNLFLVVVALFTSFLIILMIKFVIGPIFDKLQQPKLEDRLLMPNQLQQ